MTRTVLVFITSSRAAQAAVLDELNRLDGLVTATHTDGTDLVLAVELDGAAGVRRVVRDVVATFDELSRESYSASAGAARLFVRGR